MRTVSLGRAPRLRKVWHSLAGIVLVSIIGGCIADGGLAASAAPATLSATSAPPAVVPTDSPNPGSASIEATPWQRALAAKDAEGQYSLGAALTLFATAFGPLPGVEAELDRSENGLVERTVAIRAVLAHESALTAEQATAIAAYIAPPTGTDVVVIPPTATSRNHIALAALSNELRQKIFDTASGWRAAISQQLGRDFVGDINVYYKERPTGMPKTIVAGAWSSFPGGVFGDCDVTVFPGIEATNDADLALVLAHEVFHCFQFDYLRTRAAILARPDWVMEGQASWVGEDLNRGGGSQLGNFAWNRYLTQRLSLVQRLNDAIGFYAHLDERGTDPWSTFLAQLDAGGNNVASFTAAGANNDDFISTWASSILRQPDRGDGWDTTGPGITTSSYSPELLTVGDGASVDLSVPFFTNEIRMLHLQSDLVHVSVEGHGRLSDGTLNTAELSDVWFCVAGHDCEPKCPEDADDMPEIQGIVGEVVAIASSGGVDGTVGRAEGRNLSDESECETPRPTPTPDEFCRRYRALLEWQVQNQGIELTQPWAAEIARQSQAMRPFAPPQLVQHVDVYIDAYGTYASAPEPMNVPMAGPAAAQLGIAFMTLTDYCGITF